ncbi:MAG: 1-deoxy-D-xylulose-5-phosphate synthase [Planctomycetes bacterium]|nr:1-deoxy-D-xylulose-5-phosphate synthase [Planctomycetota bacterium]
MTQPEPAAELLARIQSPRDLRRLPVADLPGLAGEIRQRIIDVVTVTGGHLGSNLGTVELTVAIHYCFDFLKTAILWDVSHQVYAHKILTGRNARFATIRQKGGLSGFANKFESPYDYFTAGHAGTALSTGLGMATGRRLRGSPETTVAVVGDAGMATGMAFEAMNHGGVLRPSMLVILNDNCWAIARTVGSLREYLDRIRMTPFLCEAKEELRGLVERVPLIGRRVRGVLGRAHELARRVLSHGLIFEELGFDYYGPIDGHDLGRLVEALTDLQRKGGFNLLHVLTNKGHGIEGAERDPERCHAANPRAALPAAKEPVKVEGTIVPRSKRPAYTKVFADHLVRLAARDERVVAITAAMPSGTGLVEFEQRYPQRFFDTGITEPHAVAFASGLAAEGLRPVVAIYSTFLQRGYDQVIHDVCLQGNPVVFALDRAGVVGPDGPTHNGVFDLAFLRTIPRLVLMAPKDGPELEAMLEFGLGLEDGAAAIRYPREAVPEPRFERTAPLELGKGEVLREGGDGVLIACGAMVYRALEAADRLAERGIEVRVVNARFIKPLDTGLLVEAAAGQPLVMTVEDHMVQGGFGDAVLGCLADAAALPPRFLRAGLPDVFLEHGTRDEILVLVGLDPAALADRFVEALGAGIDRAVSRGERWPLPHPC